MRAPVARGAGRGTAAAPPAARHGALRLRHHGTLRLRHRGARRRRVAPALSPRVDLQAPRAARGGGRSLHDGPPLLVRPRSAPQRRSGALMRTRPAAARLWLGLVGRAFGCDPQLASASGRRAGRPTRCHGVDAAPCQPAARAWHRGRMNGRRTALGSAALDACAWSVGRGSLLHSTLYQLLKPSSDSRDRPFRCPPRGLVSLAQPMGHFLGVYTPNGDRQI